MARIAGAGRRGLAAASRSAVNAGTFSNSRRDEIDRLGEPRQRRLVLIGRDGAGGRDVESGRLRIGQ